MKYSQKMIEMRLESLLKRSLVYNLKELELLPDMEKVLVISPHFDDDVLSCYAAMSLHIRNNHKVDILYITDGSASEKDGCNSGSLCELRRKEAINAVMKLNKNINIYFLDEPDGTFYPNNKSISSVKEILGDGKYTTIYSPHWQDGHKDHRMTSRLLKQVLSGLDLSPRILLYEFWVPLQNPNCYVKLDNEVASGKWEAIECHKSQMAYLNYKRLAQIINEFRGMQLKLPSCEVFKKISKEEFINQCI